MTKRIQLACLALLSLMLCCCTQHHRRHVASVETQIIVVDSLWDALQDSVYLSELSPRKQALEEQLNIPIGHAPEAMSAYRPESELLNWACDALLAMAHKYYQGQVDLAVVNIGGLRCEWPAGDITFRHVFELMPFDNELVILTLSGEAIQELAQNCVNQHGQGVSKGFQVIGEEGQVADVTLFGQAIDPEKTYYVATSDYLSGGADGLSGLTRFTERVQTGKKMRDLYIEYIDSVQVVEAAIDGRMIIE